MTSHEDGGNLLPPIWAAGVWSSGGPSCPQLTLEIRVPPVLRVKHYGPPLTSLRGTEGRGLGSHNEIESQMDAMGFSMGWEVRSRV